MYPDKYLAGKQFVIGYSNYGEMNVFNASLENAMAIFKDFCQPDMPEEIKEIAQADKSVKYYLKPLILKAVQGVLTLESKQLRILYYGNSKKNEPDTRPEVLFDTSWSQELKLFLFDNKINGSRLDYMSNELLMKAIDQLSFLQQFKQRFDGYTLRLIDNERYLDAARQYKMIVENSWKEGTAEIKKVGYVIDFIGDWANEAGVGCELLEVGDWK